MHCNGDILRNQSTFKFSSNKIPICLITNLKRVDKHPRSVVLTDDGLWPLLKLFVKRMHNTCTRFMSWNGHWLTKLFESPCDKLVITLTRDAYGKYNSRALTRTQVIFPVIITWSCYNYHLLILLLNSRTDVRSEWWNDGPDWVALPDGSMSTRPCGGSTNHDALSTFMRLVNQCIIFFGDIQWVLICFVAYLFWKITWLNIEKHETQFFTSMKRMCHSRYEHHAYLLHIIN